MQKLAGIGPGRRLVDVDVRNDRGTDEQRELVRIVVLKLDADREDLAKKGLAASRLVRSGFSCEAMADRWLKMLRELPAAATEWPVSQKVTYSLMMRRVGFPFLPAFRPVGKLINRVAGKKLF